MQDNDKGSTIPSDAEMLAREMLLRIARRVQRNGGDLASRQVVASVEETAAQLASLWKSLHEIEEGGPEDASPQRDAGLADSFYQTLHWDAMLALATGVPADLGRAEADICAVDAAFLVDAHLRHLESRAAEEMAGAEAQISRALSYARVQESAADPAASDLPPGPLPRDPNLRPIDREDEERLQDLAHAAEDAGMVPTELEPEKGEPS